MLYYRYSKGKLKTKTKKKGFDTMFSVTAETTTRYKVSTIYELQERARQAKQEYEWARDRIMGEIRKFLDDHPGKGYTAKELSEMSGLPPRVIARESYHYRLHSRPRIQYVKFVELLPDGESVNYNHQMVQRIKCNEYYR